MNYIENLLPIGTVVLLDGGTKTLMIIGYYSTSEDDENTVYDYTGVLYPEGLSSSDEIGFFNHSQIKQVICRGFLNEPAQTFLNNLKTYIKNENAGNNQIQESTQQKEIQ